MGNKMIMQLRRGPSDGMHGIEQGEVCYDVDSENLLIGIGGGATKVVSKVLNAPDGTLFAEVPEGMIPMCIRNPFQLSAEAADKDGRPIRVGVDPNEVKYRRSAWESITNLFRR